MNSLKPGGPTTISRQILEEEYNDLYNSMLSLLKEFNPCKPTKFGCVGGDFCCHGCKYLGTNGCTVLALPCKTWFCHSVELDEEMNLKRFEIIRKANHFGFYGVRYSRRDSLNRAFNKWKSFYNLK